MKGPGSLSSGAKPSPPSVIRETFNCLLTAVIKNIAMRLKLLKQEAPGGLWSAANKSPPCVFTGTAIWVHKAKEMFHLKVIGLFNT